MTAPEGVALGSGRRLVGGGSLLAGAMLLANGGNYLLNLFLGRVLTPAEFSDANLMVTFLFTLTSIALCLQLVAARFIARSDALGFPGDSDALARRLRRIALAAGITTGAVLAGACTFWSFVFQTASPWPFVILAVGVPFWLVQAVGRGVMQARLRFTPLAMSFIVEMVTRVGLGVMLVSLGLGVPGATVALSVSFIVTSLMVSLVSRSRNTLTGDGIPGEEVRAYAALVSVLLLGQIIANNSDIFIAKVVFTPTEAGIYAAVALVGRAVFFLAWSVATVIFPVVARRHAAGQGSAAVLRTGVLAVVAIGAGCSLAALWLGGPVLGVVLGPVYGDLSVPLAAYAGMTTLFAIGNLIASYRLSQSRVTESWLLLGASLLQLLLLLIWHADMGTLIAMQLIAMSVLMIVLCIRAVVHRVGMSARSPREAL
ncbi:oligosaccharide flippase family protein [Microbacterium sp. SSW1-49]|uniref:Oligosaccharide flippase family protein n=1 Tax=Microbacterium croceum TaxID=2851645 RepID=A0ABT0FHZ2_9MICO|nr:oligosaccharide flippase family protein [Microbacterium croceum]MCK2037534.1 oligosaccharide flippase family protein [Microbacterium croceum]